VPKFSCLLFSALTLLAWMTSIRPIKSFVAKIPYSLLYGTHPNLD